MAERMRRGSFAWAVLALGVLAWDLLARDGQTLSEAFRGACAQPRHRAVIAAGWAVLTLHLFGVLPRAVDPLHGIYAARAVSRARR